MVKSPQEGPGICHHQVTIVINGLFPRHCLSGPHTPRTTPGFYSSVKLWPKPHGFLQNPSEKTPQTAPQRQGLHISLEIPLQCPSSQLGWTYSSHHPPRMPLLQYLLRHHSNGGPGAPRRVPASCDHH